MRPIGQKRRRGFTLVELIAVLAIVALFGALAVPTLISYRQRRSRDLDNAALVLRATLRAARLYAIQNRVRAGVVFGRDIFDRSLWRRYHVEYQLDDGTWAPPFGMAGKDTVLPQNLSLELDTTWERVPDEEGRPPRRAYVFDETGTLDNPSALKAVIRLTDNDREVSPLRIEILRPTGRVRIKG